MTKFIKFTVSEERFTYFNKVGFEKIDHILNELIDENIEQIEKNYGRTNNPK